MENEYLETFFQRLFSFNFLQLSNVNNTILNICLE